MATVVVIESMVTSPAMASEMLCTMANLLRKMRTGSTEPVYEKYVLKALGIVRLKNAPRHGELDRPEEGASP